VDVARSAEFPQVLLQMIPVSAKSGKKSRAQLRNSQYVHLLEHAEDCKIQTYYARFCTLTSTLLWRTVYADMAYKALTVEELLQLMKKIQGEKTNTEFAAEIGISKQYLTDIYNGRKVPSDTVSAALGYEPHVETRYLPSATAANQETPRAASFPKLKATRSRKRDSR
jgi:Helix-turn-helix